MAIRIVPLCMTGSSLLGEGNFDFATTLRRRLEDHLPAQRSHSFANNGRPAPRGIHFLQRESPGEVVAAPIIHDSELPATIFGSEADFNVRSAAMLADVDESLLEDTSQFARGARGHLHILEA